MAKVLTKREKEVFELLILNKSTKDIAKELNISDENIKNKIVFQVFAFIIFDF